MNGGSLLNPRVLILSSADLPVQDFGQIMTFPVDTSLF